MRRRLTGRAAGALSSEYAGVSSDKMGENPIRRKPKVSRGKAPKARLRSVADGHQVDIPEPP